MVMRLAEQLEVPLRERNAMLLAAGFAPVYQERGLDAPELAAARAAVDLILAGHEPYPALAVDRHWNLVAANRAVFALLSGVSEELLEPPVNVLRLSLHPSGLASRIANYGEWREHLLERLSLQVSRSGDPVLAALLEELSLYPSVGSSVSRAYDGIVVPFQLRDGNAVLSFFSTTTVFGTPVEITLSELAIEAFFPADEATALLLRGG